MLGRAFLFLLAITSFSGGTPALAQDIDCGSECKDCSDPENPEDEAWEGYNVVPDGDNHIRCTWNISTCATCGSPPPGGDQTTAWAIVERLDAASNSELPSLAARYADRLLLILKRDLIVVRGSSCDSNALVAALFLNAAAATALRKVGLLTLEATAEVPVP